MPSTLTRRPCAQQVGSGAHRVPVRTPTNQRPRLNRISHRTTATRSLARRSPNASLGRAAKGCHTCPMLSVPCASRTSSTRGSAWPAGRRLATIAVTPAGHHPLSRPGGLDGDGERLIRGAPSGPVLVLRHGLGRRRGTRRRGQKLSATLMAVFGVPVLHAMPFARCRHCAARATAGQRRHERVRARLTPRIGGTMARITGTEE
jgi:hypothetical protein